MIKELVNGNYLPQYVDFPSMMRIQIKKHSLFLQPLFEAFSNSLEALRGNNNAITVRIKQAKASLYNETDLQFNLDFSHPISVNDTYFLCRRR